MVKKSKSPISSPKLIVEDYKNFGIEISQSYFSTKNSVSASSTKYILQPPSLGKFQIITTYYNLLRSLARKIPFGDFARSLAQSANYPAYYNLLRSLARSQNPLRGFCSLARSVGKFQIIPALAYAVSLQPPGQRGQHARPCSNEKAESKTIRGAFIAGLCMSLRMIWAHHPKPQNS